MTRYRRSLIRNRTREMQRVEKLIEDAQIKITPVGSDVFSDPKRIVPAQFPVLEACAGGTSIPNELVPTSFPQVGWG
ncbi:hypothetical protein ABZ591_35855 [Micromonospora fulviviridis]|uniref:hypothetical protein n=1 Tax=Micromonospora fulviviridis TaxID=47860 RepID=UPI00340B6B60